MKPRDLVTGGAGFIGSHLVESLLADGREVVVFDDLSTGKRGNLAGLDARLIEGDVRDEQAVAAAVAGCDTVYHLAALVSVPESVRRPLENDAINIGGTLRVLEAARLEGARRVVLASSAAVYGDDPAQPKREDMAPRPLSPYAVAKLTLEHYARMETALHGLGTVSLRFFNVYGPRQDPGSMYSGVISKFCQAAALGETPVVFGDGRQTRDFVHVGDVVRALRAAAETAEVGGVFNVGRGERVSLLDLLATIGDLFGRSLSPRFEPARAGDVRDSLADIGAARHGLGYEPRMDLRTGLATLME